ncbi:hypothetical protein [Synechococcus sp. CBW1002]|jgi:hypothetical protein|nr:hypothetical protein [Synechococcus sp. CBW1002]
MGSAEVKAFLSHLAVDLQVSGIFSWRSEYSPAAFTCLGRTRFSQ